MPVARPYSVAAAPINSAKASSSAACCGSRIRLAPEYALRMPDHARRLAAVQPARFLKQEKRAPTSPAWPGFYF